MCLLCMWQPVDRYEDRERFRVFEGQLEVINEWELQVIGRKDSLLAAFMRLTRVSSENQLRDERGGIFSAY